MASTDQDLPEGTVKNVLDQDTLKWVFVGGKGGVGKTTCSSILGILLSQVRSSVLIISTDPAHNLSDAFQQRFTKAPTLVNGFTNLYAMEVDPTVENEDTIGSDGMDDFLSDLANAIPGIDEAMSFAEMLKIEEKEGRGRGLLCYQISRRKKWLTKWGTCNQRLFRVHAKLLLSLIWHSEFLAFQTVHNMLMRVVIQRALRCLVNFSRCQLIIASFKPQVLDTQSPFSSDAGTLDYFNQYLEWFNDIELVFGVCAGKSWGLNSLSLAYEADKDIKGIFFLDLGKLAKSLNKQHQQNQEAVFLYDTTHIFSLPFSFNCGGGVVCCCYLDLTTFVCVCIPEFLSLYETERLVQELTKFEIDTHNIIINQVLFDEEVVESKLLKARMRMQQKYLDQFYMLYDDFNITKLPLLPQEVCGVEALKAFSHRFLTPYQPSLIRGSVEELEMRIATLKEQLKDSEEELEKLRAGQQQGIM
uniref:ArsA/GET3 Anion-transporting ATPase-like domain-containing protein n=1 Tax=Nicotiana tabacum TaxID=4097 RepID=A0A1S3YCG5_TOBAC|nr:PREDICTED: uncharacterized protein LOC107774770 [Nicotiana tabacum]